MAKRKNSDSVREALSSIPRGRALRLRRAEIEDGWFDGFLVAEGEEIFALHTVDAGVRLDGFSFLRHRDVTYCEVGPHREFLERALQLRGEKIADELPVDLSSWQRVLASAAERWPLVVIHHELHDPDVCYVGQVCEVDERSVTLRGIDPDGVWEEELEHFDLRHITRVDCGGAYVNALALVAADRDRTGS